jgi:hypothetical protein
MSVSATVAVAAVKQRIHCKLWTVLLLVMDIIAVQHTLLQHFIRAFSIAYVLLCYLSSYVSNLYVHA